MSGSPGNETCDTLDAVEVRARVSNQLRPGHSQRSHRGAKEPRCLRRLGRCDRLDALTTKTGGVRSFSFATDIETILKNCSLDDLASHKVDQPESEMLRTME